MTQKRKDTLVVLISLGALLATGIWAVFLHRGDFSEAERRYLSPAPAEVSLEKWTLDREFESWIADRLPLRQALVGIDAEAAALTGRRTQLAAWPLGETILEAPVTGSGETLQRRLEQFAALAEAAGKPWHLVTPPTHGSLRIGEMNAVMRALYQEEGELAAELKENSAVIPLSEAFAGAFGKGEKLYYRTDHHWTTAGAYLAYERICRETGREALPIEAFRRESFPGFRGTTASRSGLPFTGTETIDCAEPAGPLTLTIDDGETRETYGSLIFPEQAAGWDGYAVFLNGNHDTVTIENPAAEEGTLLVFKDSFANCLLPLLSGSWRRIIAVDARYRNERFSEVIRETEPDEILFCYSLDSLMNDTMLVRKAK